MSVYFWIKDLLTRPATGLPSRVALWPMAALAWLYGGLLAGRRWAYRKGLLPVYRSPVPVIAVGNLTAGGTGKTPCVEKICRILLEAGYRPAVISRGYGGRYRGSCATVADGARVLLGPEEAGDEPVLLARSLPGVPVLIARKRADGAREAVSRHGAQVLVLDDAFQHLRMGRDLDVVTVDAKYPLGNGYCFPRGLLRERPATLKEADLILLTRGTRLPPEVLERSRRLLRAHNGRAPILTAGHASARLTELNRGERAPPEWLRDRKVLAFAGIGAPSGFFGELENLGARVLEAVPFPDHHPYTRQDVQKLVEWAKLMNAEAMVTTEKDAVRLVREMPLEVPLLALGIEIVVQEGEAALAERILEVVSAAG